MNWTLVLIESVSWCLLFTVIILLSGLKMKIKKDYTMAELNYPPEIIDRLVEQGKIEKKSKKSLGKRLLIKLPLLIIYVAAFTCLLYFANGTRTFLDGFISSLVIFLSWTWFDAFFLDMVIFCNTKLFVIPGTEDMKEAYHDYWFHIKASLVGSGLSIAGSLLIGGTIAVISII